VAPSLLLTAAAETPAMRAAAATKNFMLIVVGGLFGLKTKEPFCVLRTKVLVKREAVDVVDCWCCEAV